MATALQESADGNVLVFARDNTAFAKMLALLTGALVSTAIYDLTIGTRGTDRLMGLIGAMATTGVMAVFVFERVRLELDRETRTARWTRHMIWGRRDRAIAFDDIAAIAAERPIGDSGTPSRRIVLTLRDGSTLPLSAGFDPDVGDEMLADLARMRHMLALREMTIDQQVAALVKRGQTVEAVKLLRTSEGLSLDEAVERTRALRLRDGHPPEPV